MTPADWKEWYFASHEFKDIHIFILIRKRVNSPSIVLNGGDILVKFTSSFDICGEEIDDKHWDLSSVGHGGVQRQTGDDSANVHPPVSDQSSHV